MFLRYGIALEQFGLLNAVWATVIVLLGHFWGTCRSSCRKALLVAAAIDDTQICSLPLSPSVRHGYFLLYF